MKLFLILITSIIMVTGCGVENRKPKPMVEPTAQKIEQVTEDPCLANLRVVVREYLDNGGEPDKMYNQAQKCEDGLIRLRIQYGVETKDPKILLKFTR